MNMYEKLVDYYNTLISTNRIETDAVSVYVKSLSAQEAIGNPVRKDYPLLNGKEVLIEADYKGSKGQAFSSARSSVTLPLNSIADLQVGSSVYDTAIFIAVLNALMTHLGIIQPALHCKNEEPEQCAKNIALTLERYRHERLLMVGYQPAMIEQLHAAGFTMRVLDLNPDNIGTEHYGVLIEDGQHYQEPVQWATVILCTGSTIINGTITHFSESGKPVYFYGTTIAGAAVILGLNRLCAMGQ
ncbi:MAG: Rossmann-like domain-containing protein [Treponema sp.]